MPGTVSPNMTDMSLCESPFTGWTNVGTGTQTLNDPTVFDAIQGSYCYQDAKNSTGNRGAQFDLGAGGVDFSTATNRIVVFWFAFSKKAFGANPMRIRFTDTSGNWSEWNMFTASQLPHPAWIPWIVKPTTTADATSGTLVTSAIRYIDWRNDATTAKVTIYWDAVRYGTGLTVYGGTASSPATFEDFTTSETANAYGIVNKYRGVYYVQGQLNIGSSGSSATYFKDTGKTVVFQNSRVGADFYKLNILSNGSADTQVYFGTKSGTAGISGCTFQREDPSQLPNYIVDLSAANRTTLGVYGSTFRRTGAFTLPVHNASYTREVLNSNFINCDQMIVSDCTVKNSNYIGGGEYYLMYKSQTVNFTVGTTVTGAGGATGTIVSDTDWGTTGVLELRNVNGTFVDNEALTGSPSGAATVNGVVGNLYITFGSQTVNYTAGNTLTGGTSGATSTISGIQDDGATGKLVLLSTNNIRYVSGETLAGSGGGNGSSTIASTSVGRIATKISSTTHRLTDSNFISLSKAVEIDTASDSYSFSNLRFSGNLFDVRNSSAGSVTIGNTGTSNASTYENTGGGSTSITTSASLTIKIVDSEGNLITANSADFTADPGTEFITSNNHGLLNGALIYVKSAGTLPGGLSINTNYFVINKTTNTFQVSLVSGGSAVDITSAGTGTHTWFTGGICEITVVKNSDTSVLFNDEYVTSGSTVFNYSTGGGTVTYINAHNTAGYQPKTVNNYTLPSSGTNELTIQLDEDRFYKNP